MIERENCTPEQDDEAIQLLMEGLKLINEKRDIARQYIESDEAGKQAIIAEHPDILLHVECQEALQSVVDARRQANQVEGHIVYY